jgi:hypothetical protein
MLMYWNAHVGRDGGDNRLVATNLSDAHVQTIQGEVGLYDKRYCEVV